MAVTPTTAGRDFALQEHAERAREKAQHEALACGTQAGGNAVGYPGYHYDHFASKQKLDIFAAILQMRHDLSVEDAADAAEKVFQKLCIPQAPK